MTPEERNIKVAQLLAELERVDENVRTARSLCMYFDEAHYRAESKRILNEANGIDPAHEAQAWRL